jgi:hypothetical protein
MGLGYDYARLVGHRPVEPQPRLDPGPDAGGGSWQTVPEPPEFSVPRRSVVPGRIAAYEIVVLGNQADSVLPFVDEIRVTFREGHSSSDGRIVPMVFLVLEQSAPFGRTMTCAVPRVTAQYDQ